MSDARSATPAVPLRRNRDYNLWWSGAAASQTGSFMVTVAVPMLILTNSGSAGQAGLVTGASAVAKFVVAFPAGAVADRCSRRRLLLLSSLMQLAAVASILIAVASQHVRLVHLAAAALVEGAGYALHSATELPLLRKVVPEPQRRAALGREQGRKAAAQLTGPPLGGTLFSWVPWAPFLAASVSFLGVTTAALGIRAPLGPQRRRKEAAPPFFPEMLEGVRYIRRSAFMSYMLLWFALVNGAFAGLSFLLVVLCHDRGASASAVGTAQGVGSAGAVLGALASAWLTARLTHRQLLKLASWVLVIGSAAMAVPTLSPLPTGLAYGVSLFLTPAVNVSFTHHMVGTVPDALTGRVSMTMMTAARSLNWLFVIAVGLAAERWDPLVPLFTLSSLFLALACANHLRRVRTQR
ncbi:MFS transporter [Streptomyces chrestomyceticus]|uniref:MFS transporter n=1 Tax=Streptomyces chrestomyceticus TaxID=68185 RepID=UPI0037AC2699